MVAFALAAAFALTPGAGASAAALKPIDVGTVNMATSMHCNGTRDSLGDAWVTLDGDYITVRDFCSDGNPVKAVASMPVSGQTKYYSCVNSGGSGTVKVCDFDWPEQYVGVKTVIFYAWDGIREYRMGTLRHWRDG